MSIFLLQAHVLIEARRCGSCLVLHIKHLEADDLELFGWRQALNCLGVPFLSRGQV